MKKLLQFNDIILKKGFRKSKEPIDLLSVNIDQIIVSNKFKHNNEVFKHFIGYQKGKIVKPLCIILRQMSGYIKYFENGSKSMSFLIKDDELVWDKYDKIWVLIKDKLVISFHSEPVYEYRFFFKLGFTPCKAEQPLRGMELQEKSTKKIAGYRKSV